MICHVLTRESIMSVFVALGDIQICHILIRESIISVFVALGDILSARKNNTYSSTLSIIK